MRFSQANWISIDAAERTLACQHCSTIMSLAHEPLNTFGFVRAIARLARGHFACPYPSGRSPFIVQKFAVDTEEERAREEAVGETFLDEDVPTVRHGDPLCLVCQEKGTYSKHGICGACQQKHGLDGCQRIVRRRENEKAVAGELNELGSATLRGIAAGAGGVN
jgi:hypothetical protein